MCVWCIHVYACCLFNVEHAELFAHTPHLSKGRHLHPAERAKAMIKIIACARSACAAAIYFFANPGGSIEMGMLIPPARHTHAGPM